MIKKFTIFCIAFASIIFTSNHVSAQCGTGYSYSTTDWDHLTYLQTDGTYITPAMASTQRFAIGVNAFTISYSGSITNNGESTIHSADTGADLFFNAVQNSGNVATITIVFDNPVANLSFSIYDIDRRQIVSVNGKDALGVDITTTIAKRTASPIITLTPISGIGTNPAAAASNTSVSNGSNAGTIDVSMTSLVKTVTLSISNSGFVSSTQLFISKISACISGSFPLNYRLISKPFTGMPGYVLTVVNNNVYYTDPSSGVSKFLFNDPGHTYINSVAYDPYNRFVYYTYSLTGSPSTDKGLKKYDVNSGNISVVLPDVTTLGIPVYQFGVESGAASFYNGSLFLGIEGYNPGFTSDRKSTIWRIDFNGSNVPYRASQVYGSLADDGSGNLRHDWSDFGVSDSLIYDFDGAASDNDFHIFNMRTGNLTSYTPISGVIPRQVAIGWDEKIYNVDGNIVQYNGTNGTTGSTYAITSTPAIPGGGSWGDAAEAFRPFLDFGDAPATYDPATSDPAVHDTSGSILRIGSNVSIEWLKRGVAATNDNFDDGISFVPVLSPGHGDYLAQVSVFNNTGSNATLIAWLDFNNNGLFDAGEGITQTVTSSASAQNKWLYWSGFSTPLVNGSTTYLRVRITSASNGMTTSNATGYYPDGEVEDYRIIVDNFPLSVNTVSFNAKLVGRNQVQTNWRTENEDGIVGYEVERSSDNHIWNSLAIISRKSGNAGNDYHFNDLSPLKGLSYYRLKLLKGDGSIKYSEVKNILIAKQFNEIRIYPNPVTEFLTINVFAHQKTNGIVSLKDISGRIILQTPIILNNGENVQRINIDKNISKGMYVVSLITEEDQASKLILINK